MLSGDVTVLNIKHAILTRVAELAYEGKLEEGRDAIPYEISPGPKAKFRCCVFREREIVKERVRLAQGLDANPNAKSNNVVQVITAACDDCQISRYTVTDNCRGCLQHACRSACKFNAITIGKGNRSYIDPSLCKECGQCAKACPYNAIADLVRPCKQSCPTGAITMDENGICVIDESKCVQCGRCVHSCPFGAIGTKTSIVDIIKAMQAGKKVYAMLAPSWEGQFGADITIDSWKPAMKKIGFEDCLEVALGGDLTAAAEAAEWAEAYKEGKKMTTSCCPAFVSYIKKHFPEFVDNISTSISPMCAMSRMLKAKDPDCVVVFIGPCVAKKAEVRDSELEGNADYALTFGEIRAMMRAKKVQLEPAEYKTQQGSVFGKRFGNSGGVTDAVLQRFKETDVDATNIKVAKCNGLEECKKMLTLWKFGKFTDDFIEGMSCIGGCVGGPSSHRKEMLAKKERDNLIKKADDRNIEQAIEMENIDLKSFSMHKGPHKEA